MGAFSFLRKDKQESATGEVEFKSRTEEASNAVRGRRKRKQSNTSDDPVDPVLPEKKRARRRLIGAVALVMAAIIGLPMVLDSEPKPLAEDIAIQIPSKDKSPVGASPRQPGSSAPAAKPTVNAEGLEKGEEIVNAPVTPAVPQVSALAPKASANPPVQNMQPQANAKPGPAARPEVPVMAQAQNQAKPDDTARARSLLEGKKEATAEKTRTTFEKKPPRYMIQVAALTSQDKVNELQGKLKSAGIRSQAQKVPTQSGDRIRIRVGPFASKDEAEKTRAKLARMGLSGTLVPA